MLSSGCIQAGSDPAAKREVPVGARRRHKGNTRQKIAELERVITEIGGKLET